MNLDEMRKHEWSVSWSGGKDSTATIILMHENNVPIREITHVRMMYDDTLPATLPVMTEFVDKAVRTFREWGYEVNIVPSLKSAKDLTTQLYKRSKFADRKGKPYGITAFARGFCKMTGVKQRTIEKVKASDYQMIGYASDEHERLNRLTDKKCSIMYELGVTEADAFEICRRYDLLSPLYELGIKRDGCWFCPNAAKRERAYLKENHPELIKEIRNMIKMSDYDLTRLIKSGRNNWISDLMEENNG